MPQPLSSFVRNATDLLALEVEELAGVLLLHLNSYAGEADSSIFQHGSINRHNFFHDLEQQRPPEYGADQPSVKLALMEAWAWLQSAGLLVERAASTGGTYLVSRRAKRIASLADFSAYQNASLLPKGQLHPLIASKVYPTYLRGEYDTAVFQAFREVEIAVRGAGEFSDEDLGVTLMREAFKPTKNGNPPGPLADGLLPVAEQEAMASLFVGAIGLYKNPQSHRNVPTTAIDAAEVINFASHLLRIVDRQNARMSTR